MSLSDPVQHFYKEFPTDSRFFEHRNEWAGIYPGTTPNQEELSELNDKLGRALVKIAKAICTEKQWSYLYNYYFLDKSQIEVAEKLDVCQSSVHKSIYGNIDYLRNERYGGSLHKISKFCNKSEEVLELRRKIKIEKIAASKYILERS